MSSRSPATSSVGTGTRAADVGHRRADRGAERLQQHPAVGEPVEPAVVLGVDPAPQLPVPGLHHGRAGQPGDRPAAQQRGAGALGQRGGQPVVEHGRPGRGPARPGQRGRGDRVDQHQAADRRAGGHRGRGHDRAEGVPGQHRVPVRRDGGQQLPGPGQVAGDVVPVPRQRRGPAEPGQVRHEHPGPGQVRDDRRQPVVVAAQPVQEHQPDPGRRGTVAVHPGARPAQLQVLDPGRPARHGGVRGPGDHRTAV